MTAADPDDMEKIEAVINKMAGTLDHLDKTLTRYAKQGANTALAREIRDGLRGIGNDVSRVDARLAYIQRVLLLTVHALGCYGHPGMAMTLNERIATMTDSELRAEQGRLYDEIADTPAEARRDDNHDYKVLQQAYRQTCGEATRRGLNDEILGRSND